MLAAPQNHLGIVYKQSCPDSPDEGNQNLKHEVCPSAFSQFLHHSNAQYGLRTGALEARKLLHYKLSLTEAELKVFGYQSASKFPVALLIDFRTTLEFLITVVWPRPANWHLNQLPVPWC